MDWWNISYNRLPDEGERWMHGPGVARESTVWMPEVQILKEATLMLAAGVDAAAALVIGLAAIEASLGSLRLFIPGRGRAGGAGAKEAVRLQLGCWLALALELELGADIVRTAVAPTWMDIGQLSAIAALRTALNFFLQQEIDKTEARGTRHVRLAE